MSAAIIEPVAPSALARPPRPESVRDAHWMSPEEFFKPIRYVTLKLTNGCNLKCSYCNVDADVPSTPRMSIERFKHIADLLIVNSEAKEVVLEFHGGEPLIMDDAWFEEAVAYAAALARKHGKVVDHPMQTNGTKLTEARLELLLRLGIQIGFSFDGPPHINDINRMAGKRVEKAIRLMVEKKKSFGLICVLSQSNCNRMREVMEYFDEIGVHDFRINFMQPQGLGLDHDLLTGEQMFQGMRAVFDHMAETDCAVLEGDVQMAVNRFVAGRYPNPGLSCWEHQCQAGRIYVAINLHGDVHACGTDMFHHRLGHVDEGFATNHVSQSLCALHHKDPWYIRCFNCPAKRICNLSCPTSDRNNLDYREAECDYTRKLFTYFTENEEKVRRVYDRIGQRLPQGNLER